MGMLWIVMCDLHVTICTCATKFTFGIFIRREKLRQLPYYRIIPHHMQTERISFNFTIIFVRATYWTGCVLHCPTESTEWKGSKIHTKSTIFIVWHTLKQLISFFILFEPSFCFVLRTFLVFLLFGLVLEHFGDCRTLQQHRRATLSAETSRFSFWMCRSTERI